MIINRFDLDNIDLVTRFEDVFLIMGVGNEEPIPHKFNMVMNPATSMLIYNKLNSIRKDFEKDEESGVVSQEAMKWIHRMPESAGPRYEEVTKAIGEIEKDKLYIIEYDDKLYKEVKKEED